MATVTAVGRGAIQQCVKGYHPDHPEHINGQGGQDGQAGNPAGGAGWSSRLDRYGSVRRQKWMVPGTVGLTVKTPVAKRAFKRPAHR